MEYGIVYDVCVTESREGSKTFLRKTVALVVSAISFAYVLCVFVPWEPYFVARADPDFSWRLIFNWAFSKNLRFGTDIIFTYGPWGFLGCRTYYPDTFPLLLFSCVLLSFVFVLSASQLVRRGRSDAFLSGIVTLCLAGGITATGNGADEYFTSFLPLLWVLFFCNNRGPHPSGRPSVFERIFGQSPEVILLIISISLIGLVKFTYFAMACSLVLFIALSEIFNMRRFPRVPIIFLLGTLAFWLLAKQPLGLFVPYLKNSLLLSSSYNEAMSSTPVSWFGEVASFLACSVLLVILISFSGRARNAAFASASLAVLLFLVFKAGFLRQDGGHVPIANSFLFATALSAFAASNHLETSFARMGSWLILLSAVVALGWHTDVKYHQQGFPQRILGSLRGIPSKAANVKEILLGKTYRRAYEEGLRQLREVYPFPDLRGTVDLYPYSVAIVLANGLDYSPRPVIQSHIALAWELAEVNASHIRNANGPHWVLFSIQTMDTHYPALEDSFTWPELLARYKIRSSTGSFLIFERNTSARSIHFQSPVNINGRLGEPLNIPRSKASLIWARIKVRPSLLGSVLSAAFKSATVLIQVRLDDGSERTFRLVLSLAEAGFLLSPLVESTADFAALAANAEKNSLRHVQSLTVVVPQNYLGFYEPNVSLLLSQLTLN